MNKELDTYPSIDCEPKVKRSLADCRLRLEAARYEAEKVVTRLLRDHDAWGHVSREGRPKERIPETREEFRNHRDEEEPPEKVLPVRFENLRLERNGASAEGPGEERSRSSRGVQEERGKRKEELGRDLRHQGCAPAPLRVKEGGIPGETQRQENVSQSH